MNNLTVEVPPIDPVIIEARSWEINPREVNLTSVGDTASVAARLGEDKATDITLRVSSENRWLEEASVLEADELNQGVIRAAAPGDARLDVSAFGIEMGEILVNVALEAPKVFFVQQPLWPGEATVEVRGYRMDDLPLDAITIDGEVPNHIEADSASLRIDPGLAMTNDCVLSVDQAMDFHGVVSLWGDVIKQPTPTDSLAIGETRRFSGRDFCLRLQPVQDASYVLAQVDRYLIDQSSTTPEPFWDNNTHAQHNFMITDRHAEPISGVSSVKAFPNSLGKYAAPAKHADPIIHADQTTAQSVLVRSTPWAVGDIFTMEDRGEVFEWSVVKLYPPNFVFAVARPDSIKIWQQETIAKIDSAFAHIGSNEIQEFYRMFGNELPVTSDGSGQLLVMMRDINQSGLASCSNVGAYMALGSGIAGLGNNGPQPARTLLRTLAHELAHNWHCYHRDLSGSMWSVEGLANVMSLEVLRSFLGVPIDANIPYEDNWWENWWHSASLPHQGHFTSGYNESEPFLTWLALKLHKEYGVPWQDALEAVVLGSTEGWHGLASGVWPWSLPQGPGLTARMRSLGDPQWDAVDARLRFVLSIAADDRGIGAAEQYNYPPLHSSWQHPENLNISNIWGVSFYRGSLNAGTAGSISGYAFPGDNGYFLIHDPSGAGIPLEGSVDIDTMEWKLLRFQ